MKISSELKKHMQVSPNKSRVWVNEAGEWCNHKHPLYPIELSRDEILKAKGEEIKTPPASTSPVSEIPPVKPEEKPEEVKTEPIKPVTPTQPAKPGGKKK